MICLGDWAAVKRPRGSFWNRFAALYQLTDRMLQARKDVNAKTIEHAEKLTRTELLKKQAEQLAERGRSLRQSWPPRK